MLGLLTNLGEIKMIATVKELMKALSDCPEDYRLDAYCWECGDGEITSVDCCDGVVTINTC